MGADTAAMNEMPAVAAFCTISKLARLVITCCAADARPVEVEIRSAQRPATGSWLTVTGRYGGVDPAQPTFPVLAARTLTAVRQPTDPYE